MTRYYSIDDIKNNCKDFFFKNGKCFNSRYSEKVYKGNLFIYSIRFRSEPREYKLAFMTEDGNINNCTYSALSTNSLKKAKKMAESISSGKRVVTIKKIWLNDSRYFYDIEIIRNNVWRYYRINSNMENSAILNYFKKLCSFDETVYNAQFYAIL